MKINYKLRKGEGMPAPGPEGDKAGAQPSVGTVAKEALVDFRSFYGVQKLLWRSEPAGTSASSNCTAALAARCNTSQLGTSYCAPAAEAACECAQTTKVGQNLIVYDVPNPKPPSRAPRGGRPQLKHVEDHHIPVRGNKRNFHLSKHIFLVESSIP